MKVLIVIASLLLLSLKPGPEKKFKVEHTINDWQVVYSYLNRVESFLDSTNLPHQDLKRVSGYLEVVKGDILSKLQPQLQEQAKLDSAEKAKNKKP